MGFASLLIAEILAYYSLLRLKQAFLLRLARNTLQIFIQILKNSSIATLEDTAIYLFANFCLKYALEPVTR